MITANESDIAQRKQELLDSLPPYYQESPEANAIMRGNASEIERKRAEAQDLLDQMFISTATWGLDYWDRVLDLPPNPRMPIDQRRKRIIVKLRGSATSTVSRLTSIVNAFVSNQSAEIIEQNHLYRFDVRIPTKNASYDIPGMVEALEEIKPAHLDVMFQPETNLELGLNISGAVSEYQITNILTPKFEMPDLHTSISYGALVAKYDKTKIEMPPFTFADVQLSKMYGGAFSYWQQTKIYPKGVSGFGEL